MTKLNDKEWFKGFLSAELSKKLLEMEEAGTFLVRFSGSRLGAFTIDYATRISEDLKSKVSSQGQFYYAGLNPNLSVSKGGKMVKTVLSLRVESWQGKFKVSEWNLDVSGKQKELLFDSVEEVISYAPLLFVRPFASDLLNQRCESLTRTNLSNSERWFCGDVSSEEAEELLADQEVGTFLVR
jgi:hypothetical protein